MIDISVICLATALYYEARGEPDLGQLAIAHVILNRVKSSSFPGSVCDVITQKRQFSFTRKFDPTKPPKIENVLDQKQWDKIFKLSQSIIHQPNTASSKFNFKSTHFIAPKRLKFTPKWARSFKNSVKIGNHVFFLD